MSELPTDVQKPRGPYRRERNSTLPPARRPGETLPVGHHSTLGSHKQETDLKNCRRCLERVDVRELDDCLGCGSADLCSTCMDSHDCEGTAVEVVQAQERSMR